MVSFRLDSHGYMLVAAREVHHGAMRSYESIGDKFSPHFRSRGKNIQSATSGQRNPDNTPLVLYYKDRSIAAARLDLLPSPVVKNCDVETYCGPTVPPMQGLRADTDAKSRRIRTGPRNRSASTQCNARCHRVLSQARLPKLRLG